MGEVRTTEGEEVFTIPPGSRVGLEFEWEASEEVFVTREGFRTRATVLRPRTVVKVTLPLPKRGC